MDQPLFTRSARHPMRRGLPIPAAPIASEDHDLKLFVLSFTAFFICFYSFFM